MSRSSVFTRVLAGMTVIQITLAQPLVAFECPLPQAQSGEGVIQESQQEIDRLSAMLGSGDLDNRLEVIALDLKNKYQEADKTELANFIVAAYCPLVAADEGLSDSEKDARLTQFSQQVWDLYSKAGP